MRVNRCIFSFSCSRSPVWVPQSLSTFHDKVCGPQRLAARRSVSRQTTWLVHLSRARPPLPSTHSPPGREAPTLLSSRPPIVPPVRPWIQLLALPNDDQIRPQQLADGDWNPKFRPIIRIRRMDTHSKSSWSCNPRLSTNPLPSPAGLPHNFRMALIDNPLQFFAFNHLESATCQKRRLKYSLTAHCRFLDGPRHRGRLEPPPGMFSFGQK